VAKSQDLQVIYRTYDVPVPLRMMIRLYEMDGGS